MTVKLDLAPQVEMAYVTAATARGLPLDAVLREVLIAGQPPRPVGETAFEQG